MPRTVEQNNAIKDKRREKLLRCALKVFASTNYDKVAVDDITKANRCSHGLFYHYFVSKEACFRYAYEEFVLPLHLQEKTEELDAYHGAEGIQKICEGLESLQKATPIERNAALLSLRAAGSEKAQDAGIDFKGIRLSDVLCRLIKEGQAEGALIEGNPKDIAYAFLEFVVALLGTPAEVGLSPRVVPAKVLYAFFAK